MFIKPRGDNTMPKKKEKEPETFRLVLYYCPYCGHANMKELEMIIADDTWQCPYCKSIMKTE
jgi:DNA-directed RNA polymerase subunit RPC12/RpoP